MKKVFSKFGLVFILVLITMFILPACSSEDTPQASTNSATTTSSQEVIELKYSTFMATSEGHTQVAEIWIDEVQKRTNDRVHVTYYPGGSLVAATQAYDSVVKGSTDLDFFCMAFTPGRFPLTYSWNLPLGIKDSDVSTKIIQETFQKYQPEELADSKILYISGSPPCPLLSKKEVNSVDDLKGMKIRSTGIGADFIKELGAVPVAMPMGDTYEALQKGVVEAAVCGDNTLHDYKFGELVNYEYLWDTYCVAFPLAMNLDKWNSLPSDIQDVILEVSAECLPMESEIQWKAGYERGMQFGIDNGMQVIETSSDDIEAALVTASKAVQANYIESISDKGLPAQEFLDEIVSLVEKYQ